MRSKLLFALGVLVLVLGAMDFVIGFHNGTGRTFAMISVLVSVYLIRTSEGQRANVLVDATDPRIHVRPTNRPGPLMWIVSAALVPLVGASYLLLRSDAVRGGTEVWPVYLFAGVMVIAMLFWSALVARLI
jgi:hypothetical protein